MIASSLGWDLASRVDAALRPVLQALPATPLEAPDLLVLRAGMHAFMAEARAGWLPPAGVLIDTLQAPGPEGAPAVSLRVYRPAAAATAPRPALLYIHGGGFFMGDAAMSDASCCDYVLQLGCVVVSVEYRLAPEHRYPAAFEDVCAAWQWLQQQAAALGVAAQRVAVAGFSAGAALAAALALWLRDQGLPAPVLQLLINPVIDDRLETASAQAVLDGRVWHRSLAQAAWRAYLPDGLAAPPAYASPGRATDLTGLAPACLCVAELDLLRDEALAYAQGLLRAGVPTELHLIPGTFHASAAMAPDAAVSQAERACQLDALRRACTRA